MNECQFADDVALLATSHDGAEEAIREYHSAAAGLGLSVSFYENQVYGGWTWSNRKCRVYLGSQMTFDGELDREVEKCVAAALRAFGALHHAVFRNRTLSIVT